MCLTRNFLQLCRASIIVKLALTIPVRWRVESNVDQRGCGRLQGLPLVRLASFLAKELLIGHNVVCVRTEDLDISGSLTCWSVPISRGTRPIPIRNMPSPLRGSFQGHVANHPWHDSNKTARGSAALDRLKSYMYDMKEIMVIPHAQMVLRLRPERRFCQRSCGRTVFWCSVWRHGASNPRRCTARNRSRW